MGWLVVALGFGVGMRAVFYRYPLHSKWNLCEPDRTLDSRSLSPRRSQTQPARKAEAKPAGNRADGGHANSQLWRTADLAGEREVPTNPDPTSRDDQVRAIPSSTAPLSYRKWRWCTRFPSMAAAEVVGSQVVRVLPPDDKTPDRAPAHVHHVASTARLALGRRRRRCRRKKATKSTAEESTSPLPRRRNTKSLGCGRVAQGGGGSGCLFGHRSWRRHRLRRKVLVPEGADGAARIM